MGVAFPELLAYTLEHAYVTGHDEAGLASFAAKLPEGTYTCVRGTHQLHNSSPFQTFEVTGVPGHTGILFHVGNYNSDSDGCVLLGRRLIQDESGTTRSGSMLSGSRLAFDAFMARMEGVDSFTLVVKDA